MSLHDVSWGSNARLGWVITSHRTDSRVKRRTRLGGKRQMRLYASGIKKLEAAHNGRQSQAEVVGRFFQIRTRDGAGVGIAEAR